MDSKALSEEIMQLEAEIKAVDEILQNSIAKQYGQNVPGKKLSTDEHFVFWDKMWTLTKKKNELVELLKENSICNE